jgi:hypothetical protein
VIAALLDIAGCRLLPYRLRFEAASLAAFMIFVQIRKEARRG